MVVSIPLKNMDVNWNDYLQYVEKQKCSKPPTRYRRSKEQHGYHDFTHKEEMDGQKTEMIWWLSRLGWTTEHADVIDVILVKISWENKA